MQKSKVLWLVSRNIPLGHHAKYGDKEMEVQAAWTTGYNNHDSVKNLDRVAATIVNGLSQYSVAELVAREWEGFPPLLRMAVTNLINTTQRSGNVTKGIKYLDKLLGGRLRRQERVQTERVVRTGADGRLYRDTQVINQAEAAASRAFAIVALPANYDKMSPAEKRRVQQELARVRRQSKQ
jgi:hypothetical protein